MADRIMTSKGFKVLRVEPRQMVNIGSLAICDHCNKPVQDFGYYVAVLNHYICKECYKSWHAKAVWYEEDSPIEDRNYEFYINQLRA